MRFHFIVSSLLVFSVFSQVSAHQADARIIGDWYAADGSNVLVLSVQKDYVLHGSEFWDYELKGKDQIQLKSQSRTKELSFSWAGDQMILVNGEDQAKLIRNRRTDIQQRPTTKVDLRKDFFKRDQVVLHGVVTPADTMPLIASVIYNDAFQERQQKYSADVDEHGRFKLIFPLNNAQDLFFQVGKAFFIFYARPSGKMAMKINEASFRDGRGQWTAVKDISFMGDLAQLNEEFRLLKPEYMKIRKYEESDSLQKVLTPMEFLSYRLSLQQDQRKFYEGYFAEYPTGDALQDLSLRSTRVNAAEDLMRYIWLHNMKGGRIEAVDVPDEYLSQVRGLMLDDVMDFTSGNYGSLSREFTMTMMPREQNELHEKRLAVTYEFLSNSVVSENMKQVLSNWKGEEQNREKHFSYLAFKGEMKPIFDQYKDEINELNRKVNWDHLMSKASNFSTVQRSSMVATYLSQNFHTRALEIPEYILDKLKEIDLLPLIVNNINEEVRNFNVLKNEKFIEGIEISETSDNVLATLKEKHKGKVIYIDVWATWCGPCITEFSYLKELKANKLKDVVYVYLCAQSQKKSFDLMLKKHELTGENYFLDKDQFSQFDKEVNITGFPTYMVITKEGKLVREGIKRPSARAELVNQLKAFASRQNKD